MTAPVFPPDRYGRRRSPRAYPRWLFPVVIAVVVLAGVGIAAKLYKSYGDSSVQDRVLRYNVVSDQEVQIVLEVSGSRDTPLKCEVRSRGVDGSEVGRTSVTVPAGDDVVTRTISLKTTKRATTGEDAGCTAE